MKAMLAVVSIVIPIAAFSFSMVANAKPMEVKTRTYVDAYGVHQCSQNGCITSPISGSGTGGTLTQAEQIRIRADLNDEQTPPPPPPRTVECRGKKC